MTVRIRRGTIISIIVSISLFLIAFTTLALLGSISVEFSPSTLVVILVLFLGIFFVGLLDIKLALHSLVLSYVRNQLQFRLASTVITRRSINIDVHENGDATVTHRIHGKVNFGISRWMSMGFYPDEPQPALRELDLRVIDLSREKDVVPEILLDEEKQKVIRIHFNDILVRGDTFHHEVKFRLLKTFYLGKEDHYTHTASCYEKDVDIQVRFPENFFVVRNTTTVTSEWGDFLMSQKPAKIVTPHAITWKIPRAFRGNRYTIRWETEPARENVP